ncbi:hypothetical protein T492DRAFT_1039026 [Pavlovales sp. CCMP2436]|nr:hypothetical protein T492DRAFT_1039026 [Pavlovales sp. CCMP2436]
MAHLPVQDLPHIGNVKKGDTVYSYRFSIHRHKVKTVKYGNQLEARPVSDILDDGSIVSKGKTDKTKTLTFSKTAIDISYVEEGGVDILTIPMALLVLEMDGQLFKYDPIEKHHSIVINQEAELTVTNPREVQAISFPATDAIAVPEILGGARASRGTKMAHEQGVLQGAFMEQGKTIQGMNDLLKSNAALLQTNADAAASKARTDELDSETRMYEAKAKSVELELRLAQFNKAAKKDDGSGPSGVRNEPLYDY